MRSYRRKDDRLILFMKHPGNLSRGRPYAYSTLPAPTGCSSFAIKLYTSPPLLRICRLCSSSFVSICFSFEELSSGFSADVGVSFHCGHAWEQREVLELCTNHSNYSEHRAPLIVIHVSEPLLLRYAPRLRAGTNYLPGTTFPFPPGTFSTCPGGRTI